MKRTITVGIVAAMAVMCVCALGGCSRAQINRQIAEAIGTTGMYENDEPVETPKMKSQRELREREKKKEEKLLATLAQADEHAERLDYGKAMEILNSISEEEARDERVVQAKVKYQQKRADVEVYTGEVPHIFFHSLIVDTEQAFDGDNMEEGYNYWMTTTEEFWKILENMYERGYALVDIHDLVQEIVDEETGEVTLIQDYPMVPKGKKPFILSLDDVNYYDYMKNDGFAKRLVLDENGEVKNLYIDADGNELIGNYDAIPLLDEFVRQHPDFSIGGAKGIVGETGYEGAFGYRTNEKDSKTYEEDCKTVKAIAKRLRETGWQIASHSYSHSDFKELTDNETLEDITSWKHEVEELVGETDIFIYPYGSEVEYPSQKLELLKQAGFRFFCGVWGTKEFFYINGDYVRQSRRNFDGYNLYHNGEYQKEFFDPKTILDPSRPAFE
ncbi:MAG: polysaccharide deacetylase family protein [Lachnospiraceae bacterium]|nr:polysaccharide deacetylase family protein [Lachnospiraceae bacterium]